jgi:hypothetical protein
MIQLSGAGKRFGPKMLFEGLDWLTGPAEIRAGAGSALTGAALRRAGRGLVAGAGEGRRMDIVQPIS